MFHSILIPTDFSPAAWRAVQVGLSLIEKHGGHLTILHIFPVAEGYPQGDRSELMKQIEKVRGQMENITKDMAENKSVDITNMVVSGHVGKTLMDFVNKEKFELVVMGVNSSGFNNLPGSHTSAIIASSKVPVLIVPNDTLSSDD